MKITILSSVIMALSMSSSAAFTVNVQRVNFKTMGAQTMALFSEAPAAAAADSTDSSSAPDAADVAVAVAEVAAPAADSTPAADVAAPAAPAIPLAGTTAAAAKAAAEAKAESANPSVTDQPKYGKEIPLPGTYVRCGRCATSYAIAAADLGTGPGRRISCGLCAHSWFQTPDRLFTLNDGHELIPLPGGDKDRIEGNVKAGREPDFMGNAKFYVGNLDFGVNEEDLRKLFAGAGEVGGVSVVAGPDGRSKGFAFVTMMDEDDTDKCMALDGSELKGRQINVKPPNND
mmetsp:Transcript_16615/g.24852  ORF Transcript_16615/g.24852 Transcript_16615/m.24852 type:complete len:288 (-) Transcript_16615:315-1178(-)